ncbi:leucine-rich repeat domain-containing protein [Clostridium tyrobutyricum]|uniref:leucine-rich repeat domain-containing protein n=1 Tax=Clostridium tyrobutyricum TaxID=1519 RepID=UPI0011C88A75|nr:leucine-rich repeat domain-containing protein [Clostridium tyrobutyricum]
MKQKGLKVFTSTALMSLVFATALTAHLVKAASDQVTRLGGSDRYQTAAQVATTNWTTSDNVVLVNGTGYADAVSASVLAKKLNAPIILTDKDTIDGNAASSLGKLKVKNVYIVGGTASVSNSIESKLKGNYSVERLAGANRYTTNLAVANKLVKLGVSKNNVLVVNGDNYPDALSVAPIAAAKDEILLLVTNNNDRVLQGTYNFAKDSNVTVVGTSSTVSNDTYKKLKADSRIDGGADRFDTNLRILNYFKSDFKNTNTYLASAKPNGRGKNDTAFADALVASAIAGKNSAPLVLLGASDENSAVINYINNYVTKDTNLQVVGGNAVIPDNVIKEIYDAVVKKSDNKIVTFKDANLEQAVRSQINKPNGILYKSDVDKIIELSVTNKGMTDISGIENLTALQTLNLSNNNLSDISPLKNLTSLKSINLNGNKISSQDIKTLKNSLPDSNISSGSSSSGGGGGSSSTKVSVTDIELNKTTDTLEVEKADSLTATILPGNATNKSVIWTSNKPEIAKVDNTGKVTAVSEGTAVITATTSDGKKTVTCTVTVNAEDKNIVTFKDSNLEKVVRNAINKPIGTLYKSDVDAITDLDAESKGVQDISGIENLTALQTLDLGNNLSISDISPLKGLANLQNIDLHDNRISDISVLKGLTNLTKLDLSANQIMGINALKKLNGLQSLYLAINHINDISALKELTNLKTLDLYNNQISDMSFLEGLTNLESLNLSDNPMSNISALKGLTNLQYLNLEDNPITDISSLEKLINLQYISLASDPISDISPLKELTNLRELYLIGNQISNINALKGLTNLRNLDLRGNSISNINALKGLTNLEYLDLNDDLISDSDKKALQDTLPNCRINKIPNRNVSVDDVKLNKTSETLTVGKTDTLIAVVVPGDATNKSVIWTSNAPEIAAVDNTGKVTAVSPGTATITVITEDENRSVSCTVTVNPENNEMIDAARAVEKAEGSLRQEDVTDAQDKIDGLLDSNENTDLQKRLDTVKDKINGPLNEEIEAVEKAESTESRVDYDSAKKLVDVLPDSKDKIILEDRIKDLNQLIDAIDATLDAEIYKTQESCDSAKKIVDSLPDSDAKTSLESRLKIVQSIVNSTKAVEKAESSLKQEDVDYAKFLVDNLISNVDKTNLTNRLQAVQNKISIN